MNPFGLQNGKTLILDGAMGTSLLQNVSSAHGCLEALVLEKPELVTSLHRHYVEAGAQALYTHTFGANPHRLMAHGLADQTEALNQSAVRLAREAAHNQAFVIGCLGPSGLSETERDTAEAVFRRQAKALVQAGVDALVVETITSLGELRVALQACRQEAGTIPLLATVSPDEEGRLSDGHTLAEAVALAESFGLAGFGLNCMTGPESVLPLVSQIKSLTPLPILIKPNAGLPVAQNGQLLYPYDPARFAKALTPLLALGVGALGGCCGTTPEHIRALHLANPL